MKSPIQFIRKEMILLKRPQERVNLAFVALVAATVLALIIFGRGDYTAKASETCGPSPECYLIDEKGDEQWGTSIVRAQEEMAGIYALADAIQSCEGWNKPNSLARRNNNPGNLKAGGVVDSQRHTIYGSSLEGRMALERLLWRHSGESVAEMSKWYASASEVWRNCVTSKL